MSRMFKECKELEYLDLSNFNTENVTNMEFMFAKCHKLKEIKGFNYFDLTKVILKNGIFEECNELKNVEQLLSLFNENNIAQNLQATNWERKEITLNFISMDQIIKYSISCCNLDLFSTLVEKLLSQFPVLKNRTIYFIANGNIMIPSLNLEQNKLKDNSQILINDMDSD